MNLTSGTQAVVFAVDLPTGDPIPTFITVPKVTCGIIDTSGSPGIETYVCSVFSITTAGFSVRVEENDDTIPNNTDKDLQITLFGY